MASKLPSFSDPDTHFSIERSDTPVDVDGYKIGEPMYLVCDYCGARVLLTREPTPGVDEINHDMVDGERCPQWNVRGRDWQAKHPEAVERIMDSIHDDD